MRCLFLRSYKPIGLFAFSMILACDQAQIKELDPLPPPDFTVSPGVETATVLDADPGAALTLFDPNGDEMVTLIADDLGQAHFAYIPDEPIVLDPNNFELVSLDDGRVLNPGDGYVIRDDMGNWSGPFSVLSVDDHPDESLYLEQELTGISRSLLDGDLEDPSGGYQYLTMRDGVRLSAMIRFPDPLLYGDGPYPTVVEYSGYSPSRPDRGGSNALIANAFGYASVAVNMRGSGCSGGVYDVFNRAQHADGYDIIEIVARQEWVLNGKVGMVGLSYPGISQLYVASTNPPSLAAVVPLSTIADAWEMQWPGGIYNQGFTRQWVARRDAESQAGGSNWVTRQIEEGDNICADNLKLSAHSVDFVSFLRALTFRPLDADARDLNRLVEQIETPVFYGGAFQDEQTGAQFGAMLDRFKNSTHFKAHLANGRHPDGYSPLSISRWFEFLEFHVAKRIPSINVVLRNAGRAIFEEAFGMESASFEPDRFLDYPDFDSAFNDYLLEPPVTVLFESGAGSEQPGVPVPRFETQVNEWPPNETDEFTLHLNEGGGLAIVPPDDDGVDQYRYDSEAGEYDFFGSAGYKLTPPIWDTNWTQFAAGDAVSYQSAPLAEDMILVGPGYVDLYVMSPEVDLSVQATLTEVRSDGHETLIQSGWLRLGHRLANVDSKRRLERSYSLEDFQPMPANEWVNAKLAIPSVAHPIRAGSSIRLILSAPGRDHGTWLFESPEYQEPPIVSIGWGNDRPSRLVMGALPDVDVPAGLPPCPGLRGQPCREFVPTANQDQ